MSTVLRFFRSLIALLFVWGFSTLAQSQLLGPIEYTSFVDSPFEPISFSYFHLEDFEDQAFNVPGVTASTGVVTSTIASADRIDSVDGDDGAIDGSGNNGDSFFTGFGPEGIEFTFSTDELPTLPTAAGVVWTDGEGETQFEAFDADGRSLGIIGPVALADGTGAGGTGEDRFFGVIHPAGISKFSIRNSAGGMEVDHLQYGDFVIFFDEFERRTTQAQ